MLEIAIPEIHVSSALAAKECYSARLGFACASSWRPDDTKDDPCYMVFIRDGVRLHVTSFRDGVLGANSAQSWIRHGITREFGVTDPDNNKIRFGKDTSAKSG